MTEAIACFMMVGLGFGFRLDSRQAHGALGGEPHGALVGLPYARCGGRPDEDCARARRKTGARPKTYWCRAFYPWPQVH
jgi:hypothetical protein